MDDIDVAQQNDELFRNVALQEHFRHRNEDRFQPVSGACITCGDDIEPARLSAQPDAVRCVFCQGKLEKRR
ncbi:MAG TPA: TraR/DksA C4-type zinc finger protein [Acidobacteriota bacterium]|nr:TraR/DksA C4-type zinc finger protein [Acidobacteriota bacterium]